MAKTTPTTTPAQRLISSLREEAVCRIACECPELSQREIAKEVREQGISCNQATVSRILERVSERALIKAEDRVMLAKERVLRELGKIAYSKITDYLEFDADSVVVKTSDEIPDELIAAVAEVSQTETKFGTNVSLKLYDKQRALDAICKIFGINAPEKQEHTGANGAPIQTEVVIKIGDEILENDTLGD